MFHNIHSQILRNPKIFFPLAEKTYTLTLSHSPPPLTLISYITHLHPQQRRTSKMSRDLFTDESLVALNESLQKLLELERSIQDDPLQLTLPQEDRTLSDMEAYLKNLVNTQRSQMTSISTDDMLDDVVDIENDKCVVNPGYDICGGGGGGGGGQVDITNGEKCTTNHGYRLQDRQVCVVNPNYRVYGSESSIEDRTSERQCSVYSGRATSDDKKYEWCPSHCAYGDLYSEFEDLSNAFRGFDSEQYDEVFYSGNGDNLLSTCKVTEMVPQLPQPPKSVDPDMKE